MAHASITSAAAAVAQRRTAAAAAAEAADAARFGGGGLFRRVDPLHQLRALCLCWLVIHQHVLGSPIIAASGNGSAGIGGGQSASSNASSSHGNSASNNVRGEAPLGAGDVSLFAQPRGGALLETADESVFYGAAVARLIAPGDSGDLAAFVAGFPDESQEGSANATGAYSTLHGRGPTGGDATGIADANATTPSHSSAIQDCGRGLAAADYPFFTTDPYVNMVVYDSHGPECNERTTSPAINADPSLPGFPTDGTDFLRSEEMACGIAPARFVFFTSDLYDYIDPAIDSKMEIRVTCARSEFLQSDTCANLLDATGPEGSGFPRVESCWFSGPEMILKLPTRLLKNSRYSFTVKVKNPPGKVKASENSYTMVVRYYQLKTIEGTKAPVDMTHTEANAKDIGATADHHECYLDGQVLGCENGLNPRGYVTGFSWRPGADFIPTVNTRTRFTFGLRTFGTIESDPDIAKFDIVAYPTDVWNFWDPDELTGAPGDDCAPWDPPPGIFMTCAFVSFNGQPANIANGFTLELGASPAVNLGTNDVVEFSLPLRTPPIAVNSYWTMTSYRYIQSLGSKLEPYTVLLDRPVHIMGEPVGELVQWELAAVGAEQWVTLELSPGNNLMPRASDPDAIDDGIDAGILVIIPPETFTIVVTSEPEGVDGYNQLPCDDWPQVDREAGRWVCALSDQTPFRDTIYRVKLRVVNPTVNGEALSWRAELWQDGISKPAAITRTLGGMTVGGTMVASIAPENQLLGGENTIRIEFTPSQNIGTFTDTRLEVEAPPDFYIRKRCNVEGYTPITTPTATCVGSDSNTFKLVFHGLAAIRGGESYLFEITLMNPPSNIDEDQNYWYFWTVRPDGVIKDTARAEGFRLYPETFASWKVIPQSRRAGVQDIIVRFIAKDIIPFDDYIRMRAPVGVDWYDTDLRFQTSRDYTGAQHDFVARDPTVYHDAKNEMFFQTSSVCEANYEYGVFARIVVPGATPVPNRWWIEHYRQTGFQAPNNWLYIASSGADGFKTQALVNVAVTPFNVVKAAWENPTLVQFEATLAVHNTTVQTPLGIVDEPAVVRLIAPPTSFTYICPLEDTVFMPPFYNPLPDDVTCFVDHPDEGNNNARNELVLSFPRGIEADVKYAFTIYVVNGPYVDPITNFFTVQTELESVVQEDATVPGYWLATRMDDTKYCGPGCANVATYEDRKVEATNNIVTFIIGTAWEDLTGYSGDTYLDVRAPHDGAYGFYINYDCTNDVGEATWIPDPKMPLPSLGLCMNKINEDPTKTYEARIAVTGTWGLGNHGFWIRVRNPMFTPNEELNFWGITILDREDIPLMSEAWIWSFPIMEILEPMLFFYNAGKSVPGQASQNVIDVSFKLTTALPPEDSMLQDHSKIVLTGPSGFMFPYVCRYPLFSPDTDKPDKYPLWGGTTCEGSGLGADPPKVTLTTPLMRRLEATADMEHDWPYEFRVLVVNPDEAFSDGDTARWHWRLETRLPPGEPEDLVDLHRVIPSPLIYPRLKYFKIDTLPDPDGRIGLSPTIIRIHFQTEAPIGPQRKLYIRPPQGTVLNGVNGGQCWDQDPVIISSYFEPYLIQGVTRLPEWVPCQVNSPTEMQLKNDEPILGGRPLMAGTVYEVFLTNVTNPQKSPILNVWSVEAETFDEHGERTEKFATFGWTVLPVLENVLVESTNPGVGLYTNFTISMKIISELPPKGSFVITAPEDYMFGAVITTPETAYDPLVAEPPPQGYSPDRHPVDDDVPCTILRGPNWICTGTNGVPDINGERVMVDFLTCREWLEWQELYDLQPGLLTTDQISDMELNKELCLRVREVCDGITADFEEARAYALSDLFGCVSRGPELTITLKDDVIIPEMTTFEFIIMGYQAREQYYNPNDNTWDLQTRDGDSLRTILDEKPDVPGAPLYGYIAIPSIVPSDTKVSSIENYVTVTMQLQHYVPPQAVLKIVYPMAYLPNPNANFPGSGITFGYNFPRQVEKRTVLNKIEIETLVEGLSNLVQYEVVIGLSNGEIAPPVKDNIWSFEVYSKATAVEELVNVNRNVTGFKIFGEFGTAQVVSSVLAPEADTVIGVWFVLKSVLEASPTTRIMVWMPPGFVPLDFCGPGAPRQYNVATDGAEMAFPQQNQYFSLPSGTYCYPGYSEEDDQHYIELDMALAGMVDYGLDYAFEFDVTTPKDTPPHDVNVWRLETMRNGVVLHLRREIDGFELQEMKVVGITPGDTTSLRRNTIRFDMMTTKEIPGGSRIVIYAPEGFIFMCSFFSVEGISNTTTCYVQTADRNIAEFTIDSQDSKEAEFPFVLNVQADNPAFTPLINEWKVEIISPLGVKIDARDGIGGFDITGAVQEAVVNPGFAFTGNDNLVDIYFRPTTILNQADNSNEIIVTAPDGWRFPRSCLGFDLRYYNPTTQAAASSGTDSSGYANPADVFPPLGMQCEGDDDRGLTITFPPFKGLLVNKYILSVTVVNPSYHPNGTNQWAFITRVANDTAVKKIVDANMTIPGFTMQDLIPDDSDEGGARRQASGLGIAATAAVGVGLLWAGSDALC